jgi:hypothetical protein
MPLSDFSKSLPALRPSNHSVTSPADPDYNCIAWALGDTKRWWEPHFIIPAPPPVYHWPPKLPTDRAISTYIALFETHGYLLAANGQREAGKEKLALYCMGNRFMHVARQLPNGKWTSKLGVAEDLDHDLDALESTAITGFGKAAYFMERTRAHKRGVTMLANRPSPNRR